eukprot:COSAG03_NODE_5128_length_1334_cov_1.848583_3_plen_112_part_01
MALLTASAVPASADPLPDRRLPPLHSLGPPLRLCVRVVCGPAAWHARSHAPAPDSIPPRGASPPPLASSGSDVSSVKWDSRYPCDRREEAIGGESLVMEWNPADADLRVPSS